MTTTVRPTADPGRLDEQVVEAFGGRLFELFTGAALSYLIDIGHRTGLFDAAAQGPGTSNEIAARAGLNERYVREWLGAMTTSGVVQYEPSQRMYWLPREHAVCLSGSGVENLAPVALITTMLGKHVSAVADAFRRGGGVPFGAFTPEIHEVMDALWQPLYNQLLVPAILPLAPGLVERLLLGARVAEIGCGSGNALVVLGAEFAASCFVGFDVDGQALERARARAAARGLSNVRFEHRDAATLSTDECFDAVLVFNALHDQAAPDAVLRRAFDVLLPGGILLMDEPRVSSNLEENIGNPVAPFTYAVSTLHCLTVSLAEGGAGLGTAFGEQVARRMLADAGFEDVTAHAAPGDPGNAVYVASKPVA